jgi:hypothetical protein
MVGIVNALIGSFATVPGDFQSIATVTGTGSSGSVSFTSIPSTYSHLQIRCIMKNTSNSTNLYIQCNGDTNNNYSYHYVYGNGSTAAAGNATSTTFMFMARYPTSTVANAFGPTIIDIIDYNNTNKYKTLRSLSGWDTGSSGESWIGSGNWRSTSAISSITLNTDATNWNSNTTFALYGIK